MKLNTSWTIRQRIGQADREIRSLQSWVEKVNCDIEEGVNKKGRIRAFPDTSNLTNIVYSDTETGEIVGRDEYQNGQLKVRLFFKSGREVGTDTLFVVQAPAGSPSFIKKRQIYLQGKNGLVIEDTFDSIGNLISKRAKFAQDQEWKQYGDIGRSIYPPVFFYPYR